MVLPAMLATTGGEPLAASSRASGASLSNPGFCSERNWGCTKGCTVVVCSTTAPERDCASARTSLIAVTAPAAFMAQNGSVTPLTT